MGPSTRCSSCSASMPSTNSTRQPLISFSRISGTISGSTTRASSPSSAWFLQLRLPFRCRLPTWPTVIPGSDSRWLGRWPGPSVRSPRAWPPASCSSASPDRVRPSARPSSARPTIPSSRTGSPRRTAPGCSRFIWRPTPSVEPSASWRQVCSPTTSVGALRSSSLPSPPWCWSSSPSGFGNRYVVPMNAGPPAQRPRRSTSKKRLRPLQKPGGWHGRSPRCGECSLPCPSWPSASLDSLTCKSSSLRRSSASECGAGRSSALHWHPWASSAWSSGPA